MDNLNSLTLTNNNLNLSQANNTTILNIEVLSKLLQKKINEDITLPQELHEEFYKLYKFTKTILNNKSFTNEENLFNRQKVKITEEQINVENIDFEIDKILIKGIAGSGKTTLCKLYSNMCLSNLIPSKQVMIYFSLRELNQEPLANIKIENLGKLIFSLCLSQNDKNAVFKLRDGKIIHDLINSNKHQIRFILDGLDEVINQKDILNFIKAIINNFPYILITSRTTDLIEYDAIFNSFKEFSIQPYKDNCIRKYIELNCFKEPNEKIEELSNKIIGNTLLKNIAGTPFFLNLLCKILKSKKVVAPDTVTGIFKEITNQENLQTKAIEFLAYEILIKKNSKYIDIDIFKKLCNNSALYHKALEDTKFVEITKEKNLSFRHDYFMEYFAACYIADNYFTKPYNPNAWKLKEILNYYKFDQRHQNVCWFIAGILYLKFDQAKNNEENNVWLPLLRFWHWMFSEPHDVTGIVEIMLTVRCLNECRMDEDLIKRIEINQDLLIEKIFKQLQIEIYQYNHLTKNIRMPEWWYESSLIKTLTSCSHFLNINAEKIFLECKELDFEYERVGVGLVLFLQLNIVEISLESQKVLLKEVFSIFQGEYGCIYYHDTGALLANLVKVIRDASCVNQFIQGCINILSYGRERYNNFSSITLVDTINILANLAKINNKYDYIIKQLQNKILNLNNNKSPNKNGIHFLGIYFAIIRLYLTCNNKNLYLQLEFQLKNFFDFIKNYFKSNINSYVEEFFSVYKCLISELMNYKFNNENEKSLVKEIADIYIEYNKDEFEKNICKFEFKKINKNEYYEFLKTYIVNLLNSDFSKYYAYCCDYLVKTIKNTSCLLTEIEYDQIKAQVIELYRKVKAYDQPHAELTLFVFENIKKNEVKKECKFLVEQKKYKAFLTLCKFHPECIEMIKKEELVQDVSELLLKRSSIIDVDVLIKLLTFLAERNNLINFFMIDDSFDLDERLSVELEDEKENYYEFLLKIFNSFGKNDALLELDKINEKYSNVLMNFSSHQYLLKYLSFFIKNLITYVVKSLTHEELYENWIKTLINLLSMSHITLRWDDKNQSVILPDGDQILFDKFKIYDEFRKSCFKQIESNEYLKNRQKLKEHIFGDVAKEMKNSDILLPGDAAILNLISGNVDEFIALFQLHLSRSGQTYESLEHESNYQAIFIEIAYHASHYAKLYFEFGFKYKSERPTTDGRCDVYLWSYSGSNPSQHNQLGIIIEFKKLYKRETNDKDETKILKDMKTNAEKGFKQLINRDYSQVFNSKIGINTILQIGICFYGKRAFAVYRYVDKAEANNEFDNSKVNYTSIDKDIISKEVKNITQFFAKNLTDKNNFNDTNDKFNRKQGAKRKREDDMQIESINSNKIQKTSQHQRTYSFHEDSVQKNTVPSSLNNQLNFEDGPHLSLKK